MNLKCEKFGAEFPRPISPDMERIPKPQINQ